MDYKKTKSGFTLIEMIIAIGLIGIISGLTADALINIMRTQKTVSIQEAIMDDSQVIIGLLKTEIQNNAVDYEEYYNHKKWGYDLGKNYGEYGKEFYDSNNNPTGKIIGDGALGCAGSICWQPLLNLISTNGMSKTIYGLEKNNSNDEYVLSVMKLRGCDNNEDGIAEAFVKENANCPPAGQSAPVIITDDLYDIASPYIGDFSPVSSTRTNITDLKFYITPNDDPYKAYAMPEYIHQPKVTIILTIKPSAQYFGTAAEKMNPIIIRTTATSRFLGGVESYKPS